MTAGDLVYVSDVAPYRGAGDELQLAGVHQSLSSAARACREIATIHGLGCRLAETVDDLTSADLDQARCLSCSLLAKHRGKQSSAT